MDRKIQNIHKTIFELDQAIQGVRNILGALEQECVDSRGALNHLINRTNDVNDLKGSALSRVNAIAERLGLEGMHTPEVNTEVEANSDGEYEVTIKSWSYHGSDIALIILNTRDDNAVWIDDEFQNMDDEELDSLVGTAYSLAKEEYDELTWQPAHQTMDERDADEADEDED